MVGINFALFGNEISRLLAETPALYMDPLLLYAEMDAKLLPLAIAVRPHPSAHRRPATLDHNLCAPCATLMNAAMIPTLDLRSGLGACYATRDDLLNAARFHGIRGHERIAIVGQGTRLELNSGMNLCPGGTKVAVI